MGGGMAFLMLKGFHPSNHTNQRRIWLAEQAAKDEEKRNKEAIAEFQQEQEKMANRRMNDGDDGKQQGLDFMYALPPGLKEKQEQEEAETARQQQLDNIGGIGDEQDAFLKRIQNAPKEAGYVNTNEVHVQPFGVDQSTVRAAQRANQKLERGQMTGEDNPFVSHRSTCLDNLKVKEQEWSVGHDYIVDAADAPPSDEAALLASLSHKDRKLLAKYTKKLLQNPDAEMDSAISKKKHKKEKKKKHKDEKKKKHKKERRRRGSSSSS